MTNHEAKFILSAYRPGGQDACEPMFEEALEQVRRDPELAAWFREERRFDESVSAALVQAVPIPSDLLSRIQAGGRVSEPGRGWTRWGTERGGESPPSLDGRR